MVSHEDELLKGYSEVIEKYKGGAQIARTFAFLASYIGTTLDRMEREIEELKRQKG